MNFIYMYLKIFYIFTEEIQNTCY